MGQQMQVYLVLYDASIMGLDPYSGKNVAIRTLLGQFPELPSNAGISTWVCARRLYVMRP